MNKWVCFKQLSQLCCILNGNSSVESETEKLVVATNGKVSNHIHDDITLVILSKLPLKSMIRFGCVQKSWSNLLKNSYFMTMFRKNFLAKDHLYYKDTSFLLHYITPWSVNEKYQRVLYSFSGERFENMIKLDWPNPFQEDEFYFNIFGSTSINGIFCIEHVGLADSFVYTKDGTIVLWNPATEDFKIIPFSPFAFESSYWDPMYRLHGFGYDQVSDDYKVIRYVSFSHSFLIEKDEDEIWNDGRRYPLWEIYSLKCDCWKKLDVDMPVQNESNVGVQVYMDGVCHWWGENKIHDEVYLVSFDLSNDRFVKTSIPTILDGIDSRFVFRHLDVLNGSIGLISNYILTTTFHISVLGEIGVKESWIKLFIIEQLPFVDHSIGVGKNGDIFFRKIDDELICFNLSTQKIEELGVKGGDFRCRVMVYKESLISYW